MRLGSDWDAIKIRNPSRSAIPQRNPTRWAWGCTALGGEMNCTLNIAFSGEWCARLPMWNYMDVLLWDASAVMSVSFDVKQY